jgi:hypothetical protein
MLVPLSDLGNADQKDIVLGAYEEEISFRIE